MGEIVWKLWESGFSMNYISKKLCMPIDVVWQVLVKYIVWNN